LNLNTGRGNGRGNDLGNDLGDGRFNDLGDGRSNVSTSAQASAKGSGQKIGDCQNSGSNKYTDQSIKLIYNLYISMYKIIITLNFKK
jgi:hypothetical protein